MTGDNYFSRSSEEHFHLVALVLDFREENGKLVAEKITEHDPVAQVVGCLELERPTDEIVADLRGEA